MVKYVKISEISNDMGVIGNKVRKVLVIFLKYDMPDNSEVTIATFSSRRKVLHQLVKLDSDRLRARVADSVTNPAF